MSTVADEQDKLGPMVISWNLANVGIASHVALARLHLALPATALCVETIAGAMVVCLTWITLRGSDPLDKVRRFDVLRLECGTSFVWVHKGVVTCMW